MQPLDLTVNKVAKSYLQKEFQEWCANEVAEKLDKMQLLEEQVDLKTSNVAHTAV